MISDDTLSVFSCDDENEGVDTINISKFKEIVVAHFNTPCELHKLEEGGRHKIYDILREDGSSLGILRVAAPLFPVDKLESEVATIRHLAAHTQVPVPKIYAWDPDASNPGGAEYMIMEKLPGVSADKVWEKLSQQAKEQMTCDVAEHLEAIFALRFDCAGSLYMSGSSEVVGPIVTNSFFKFIRDGSTPDETYENALHSLRGPFKKTSDFYKSFVLVQLHFLSHHPDKPLPSMIKLNEDEAKAAKHNLLKALNLCSLYPGDIPILGGKLMTTSKPFSIRLEDFLFRNIMIDEVSGHVTGIIDLEEATIAPLWECSFIPGWLLHPDDFESSDEGGSVADRKNLRDLFLSKMGEEWRASNEIGKPFRKWTQYLELECSCWVSVRDFLLDERFSWAKEHPGVGFNEEEFDLDME